MITWQYLLLLATLGWLTAVGERQWARQIVLLEALLVAVSKK